MMTANGEKIDTTETVKKRKQSSNEDTTTQRKKTNNKETKDKEQYRSDGVEFLIRTRDNIDDIEAAKPFLGIPL
jgi:hypothetical protein